MSRLLPLFPLQLVVFPGGAVPLHIFEDRYKEMVGEAEAAGAEFGVVLAKDGGIVNTGCTVLVESVLMRYPDGRFDVMTRGQRRFVLKALDQEKEYLRAEVEYYADEEPESAPAALRERAVAAFGQMMAALTALTGEVSQGAPHADHPFLSFQLAEQVDDLDFRNLLQRSRSEAERLRAFVDFAGEYVDRKQYTARMKRLAPQNGFGHKPAGQ
jgi:ATP-dependent Lon protease